MKTEKQTKQDLARAYFDAFHSGKLLEVFKLLSPDCTVRYGTENPMRAKEFFESTKEIISSLKFTVRGYYTSPDTNRVLVDFEYTKPQSSDEPTKSVDAVDIITFNAKNEINEIFVIPNE